MRKPSSIHAAVHARVRDTPLRTAVDSGDVQLSYAMLWARASRGAAALRNAVPAPRAVPTEQLKVMVCVADGWELPTLMLATLLADGVFVPMGLSAPPARLASVLDDSRVDIVVVRDVAAEATMRRAVQRSAVRPTVLRLDAVLVNDAVDADGERAAADIPEAAGEEDAHDAPARRLCHMIYTSGSTGVPKGVLVQHSSLLAFCRGWIERLTITCDSRVLIASAHTFDPSIGNVFAALIAGGVVLIPPRSALRLALGRTLQRSKATHVCLTPTTLAMIDAPPASLPHLISVQVGGEAMSWAVARPWACATHVRLWNVYGATEATVYQTAYEVCVEEAEEEEEEDSKRRGRETTVHNIGRPLRGCVVYVMGPPPDCARLPIGSVGEICVSGAYVASGYHRRPALSKANFLCIEQEQRRGGGIAASETRSSEEEEEEEEDRNATTNKMESSFRPPGLYRTGDRGRLQADGTFELLGRWDRQVKVNGRRLELGEVEALLAKSSIVAQAAVEYFSPTTTSTSCTIHTNPASGGEAESVKKCSSSGNANRLRGLIAFIALQADDDAAAASRDDGREDESGEEQEMSVHALSEVDELVLEMHCHLIMPDHMSPSRIFCVYSKGGALPLTSSAKIDRQALRTHAAALAAAESEEARDRSADSTEMKSRLPLDAAEWWLRKLWADVLGIGTEMIGRDSDFWRLGGDSLVALRMIMLVHRLFDAKHDDDDDSDVREKKKKKRNGGETSRAAFVSSGDEWLVAGDAGTGLLAPEHLRCCSTLSEYATHLRRSGAKFPTPSGGVVVGAATEDGGAESGVESKGGGNPLFALGRRRGAAGRRRRRAFESAAAKASAESKAGSAVAPLKLRLRARALLLVASARGDLRAVSALLHCGVASDGGFSRARPGTSPLHIAAANGRAAVVGALLAAGATPTLPNAARATAAHLAAQSSAVDEGGAEAGAKCAELLLDAGVPVSVRDENSQTLLHYAARAGNVHAAKAILRRIGAEEGNEDGDEGLSSSAACRLPPRQPCLGSSAAAAAAGKKKKVSAMVEARDRWARTALHWAALNGHAAVLEMLLKEAKAAPNPVVPPRRKRLKRTHARYETPLHAAARKGHRRCVALLLAAGADRDATNDDGMKAVEVAHLELGCSSELGVLFESLS